MTERRNLILTFGTSLGESRSVSIPRAKAGLTGADLEGLAAIMMRNNLVLLNGGRPTALQKAEIVHTEIDTII